GVQIRQIEKGGLGEQAGLRVGDVRVEIAGRAPAEPADVSDAVQRQAPGTWLPLKVRREGRTFEVIAKFPPAAS
ncbi:MAG: PDZ domain-containing protein, partial [Betaproteobacteria bacterium]